MRNTANNKMYSHAIMKRTCNKTHSPSSDKGCIYSYKNPKVVKQLHNIIQVVLLQRYYFFVVTSTYM